MSSGRILDPLYTKSIDIDDLYLSWIEQPFEFVKIKFI